MLSIKILSSLAILISLQAFALPLLKTKQAAENLRYLSSDGKITYYKKSSGELQFSTNYKFKTVLKSEPGTDYLISADTKTKKIIIEKISSPLQNVDYFKKNKLYLAEIGSSEQIIPFGYGNTPRLHLDGKWASFYDRKKKEIWFKSLTNLKQNESKVKLFNKVRPFFTPEVVMLTTNDILYNDYNKTGYSALLHYSILEKRFVTIYKSRYPSSKIEFCKIDDQLYIGEFPQHGGKKDSLILKTSIYGNKDFKKTEIIYTGEHGDIGNMICMNDSIYFSKATRYNSKNFIKNTEIAKINIKTNKLEILSNLKYLSQLIKLGDQILTPLKGKYYIVSGKQKIFNDEIKLKK